MRPYVIFDMDGTLIDSERWYLQKYADFFMQQGYAVKEKELIDTMGLPTKEILLRLKEYFPGRDLDELFELIMQYIKGIGEPDYRSIVFPHVEETLRRINNNGIDIIIASSSPRGVIHKALEEIGIFDVIAFYVGQEDVKKTKPDSEIYLNILKKKKNSKPLVVVEDSTFGILSAKKAGLDVVAFDNSFGARDQTQSDYKITDHFELFDIIKQIQREQLANILDHTLLKAYATKEDFKRLCRDASDNHFAMVAVNSSPVKLCKELLTDSPVHVGAAISFPLGQTDIETKIFETEQAIRNGADEIDYVINIGELKGGNWRYIENEMREIVTFCKERNVISKVIFENCYLTKEEIKALALIAKKVEPDFIKTSTGFGTSGALAEDVRLMKETVGDKVQVKAAGGIRDYQTVKAMIEAGATRIGTSSSVAVLKEFDELYHF